MFWSISDMSVYDVNNRLDESGCELVSLGSDCWSSGVAEVGKMTAAAYCSLQKEALDPWLDDIALLLLRTLIFIHGNMPSPSARARV